MPSSSCPICVRKPLQSKHSLEEPAHACMPSHVKPVMVTSCQDHASRISTTCIGSHVSIMSRSFIMHCKNMPHTCSIPCHMFNVMLLHITHGFMCQDFESPLASSFLRSWQLKMSVRSSLHACMQVHDRQDHGSGKSVSCASPSSQSERSTRHDMFPACSAWLLAAGLLAGCQGCVEEPCAHDIWHVHSQICMHEVRLCCKHALHTLNFLPSHSHEYSMGSGQAEHDCLLHALHAFKSMAWDQGSKSVSASPMHACMP